MVYFDPLYGKIQLAEIVEDMLGKCSELKRLRYISMMNFKSLSMFSLTNMNRLEHSIGLTYLADKFSENNKIENKNDLVTAALYHDVNCTPYGHAIEWAINRYTDYRHEAVSEWIKSNRTIEQPTFYDINGLKNFGYQKKYNLNFEKIVDIIKGDGCFIINNRGIDLDNIDNVFRMGFYLGIYNKEKNVPLELVDELRAIYGIDNFVTTTNGANLIEEWHHLRSEIYKYFIYSREYFSYESLLFRLISEYVNYFEKDDIKNLWIQTDETLLHHLIKSKSKTLSQYAKRVLLSDLDHAYSIISSSDYEKKSIFESEEFQCELIEKAVSKYNETSNGQEVDVRKISLHLTTDNRKTNRKIEFYIQKPNDLKKEQIGRDEKYLLLGILGQYELEPNDSKKLTDCFLDALSTFAINDANVVEFHGDNMKNNDAFRLA